MPKQEVLRELNNRQSDSDSSYDHKISKGISEAVKEQQ